MESTDTSIGFFAELLPMLNTATSEIVVESRPIRGGSSISFVAGGSERRTVEMDCRRTERCFVVA